MRLRVKPATTWFCGLFKRCADGGVVGALAPFWAGVDVGGNHVEVAGVEAVEFEPW